MGEGSWDERVASGVLFGGKLGGSLKSSVSGIESRLYGVGGFAMTDDDDKGESSYDCTRLSRVSRDGKAGKGTLTRTESE